MDYLERLDILLGETNDTQIQQTIEAFLKNTVSEMIGAYRSQDWDGAKKLVQKIREESETAAGQEVGPLLAVKAASSDRFRLDVLCELYESRISQYEVSPPPENWDGVFIATTK